MLSHKWKIVAGLSLLLAVEADIDRGMGEIEQATVNALRSAHEAELQTCLNKRVEQNGQILMPLTMEDAIRSQNIETGFERSIDGNADIPLEKNGFLVITTREYDPWLSRSFSESTRINVGTMRYDHKRDIDMNQFAHIQHLWMVSSALDCLKEKKPMI